MPLIETKPDAVAITYARALFDVVKGGGESVAQQTLAELQGVMDIARQDKQFGEFLASRIIDSDKRSLSLDRIFAGKVSPMVVSFLKVLNDKGRLSSLPGVVEAFATISQESFGSVQVHVTTAQIIGEGERSALAQRLQAKLGKTPVLHCTVNPAILGGIRIQIGDKLIDSSVATRLAQVRDKMNEHGSAAVRQAAERIFAGSANGTAH